MVADMSIRDKGFFPFSSVELDALKAGVFVPGYVPAAADVGRLLATIEWYQAREVDIATRLGNSRSELDVLFSPEEVAGIPTLEDEDTQADLHLSFDTCDLEAA